MTSICQPLPLAVRPLPPAVHALPPIVHPVPIAVHPLPIAVHPLPLAAHPLPTAVHPLSAMPPSRPTGDWPSLCDISNPFHLPPLGMALLSNYFDLCRSVSNATGVHVNDLTATDADSIRVMHPCLAAVVRATLARMSNAQLDELRARARHAAFLCRGVGHRTQEQIRQRRLASRKTTPAASGSAAQVEVQPGGEYQIPWVSDFLLAPPPPPPPPFQAFSDAHGFTTNALLEAVDLCAGGLPSATLTEASTTDSQTSSSASSALALEMNNTGLSIQRVHASDSVPVYFPAPNPSVHLTGVDLLPWVPLRSVSPRMYARTIPLLPGYREITGMVAAALGCFTQDLCRSKGTVRYMHPRLAAEIRRVIAGLSDEEIAEIGVRGRAKFKQYRERHEKRIGYTCYQPHAKRNRKGVSLIPSFVVGDAATNKQTATLCDSPPAPTTVTSTAAAAASPAETPAALDRQSDSAFSTPVRVPVPVGLATSATHRPLSQMPTWMVQIILDARAGAATLTA